MSIKIKKRNDPVPVAGVLVDVISELEKNASFPGQESLDALKSWHLAAGEKICRGARAVSLSRGKLFVEAKNPVWKQEVMLNKRRILDEINRTLGSKIVWDLVVNVRNYTDGR